MEITLNKDTFNRIKEMKFEINDLFLNLESRITKLKELYTEFIESNTNKTFVFGLDSFYFQTNLLQNEYFYLQNYFNLIMNRMYCEYYKLYRIMIDYVNSSNWDKKIKDLEKNKHKFPVYKDLEPTKVYDFDIISDLNDEIIFIISTLNGLLDSKQSVLKKHINRNSFGLNIDNFVASYNFELNMLKEQINLYSNFLTYFYSLHKKYLKRFKTKLGVLEAQINSDIKFEGGILNNSSNKKELLHDLDMKKLTPDVSKELRRSIVGTSSPISNIVISINEQTPSDSSDSNNSNENISPSEKVQDDLQNEEETIIKKLTSKEYDSSDNDDTNNLSNLDDNLSYLEPIKEDPSNSSSEENIDENDISIISDIDDNSVNTADLGMVYGISNEEIKTMENMTKQQKRNAKKRLKKKLRRDSNINMNVSTNIL